MTSRLALCATTAAALLAWAPPAAAQDVFDGDEDSAEYQGDWDEADESAAAADDSYVDEEIDESTWGPALEPYGHWEQDPALGPVWVPRTSVVGPSWRPYTRGHWQYTSAGWTWVSDFGWGWLPFHYGRWARAGHRWLWVPGRRWAPAWVAWRGHSDAVGWAPLGPGMAIGASVGPLEIDWTFVPVGYLGARHLRSYYLPRHRANYYYRYGRPWSVVYRRGNRLWYPGPRRTWVERRWHRPVHRTRYVPPARRGRGMHSAPPARRQGMHSAAPARRRSGVHSAPPTRHRSAVRSTPSSRRAAPPAARSSNSDQRRRRQSAPAPARRGSRGGDGGGRGQRGGDRRR